VNWSADATGEVPLGVTTVTSTVPEPAGDVAVTLVSLFTVIEVAAEVPNMTVLAPLRPEPVMLTTVPPIVGPVLGETPVTTGLPGI
jgi:hypothetical protein